MRTWNSADRKTSPTLPSSRRDTVTAAPAVRLRGVFKKLGEEVVLRDYTLDVARGGTRELTSLSPTGVTTVLDLLRGRITPDHGEVRLFGLDVATHPDLFDNLITSLPDDSALPGQVTGRDWLLRAVTPGGSCFEEHRAVELLETCGLARAGSQPVGTYSAGMRRRLTLASALVRERPLLVLNCPFDGIDPFSVAMVSEALRRYTASGGTIVSGTNHPISSMSSRVVATP